MMSEFCCGIERNKCGRAGGAGNATAYSQAWLYELARRAYDRLAEAQPASHVQADAEVWVSRAGQALSANLAAGRWETARQFQSAAAGDESLLAYAGQVLAELIAEWERIAALRRGDSAAWLPVLDRLGKLAYYRLGPHGREDWAAWEARELAARTCADLWAWLQEHPYPFDVPFDRWSATALQRRLCQAARAIERRERRCVAFLDQPAYDRQLLAADCLVDPRLERIGDLEALWQALGRLAPRDVLVLRLWYLEQRPAAMVASEIGCSVENVYLVRFRAIARLRRLLTEGERIDAA